MKGPGGASGPGETNGGAFDFNIKDTREGELWGCAYALAWAFEKYKPSDLDSIVLQCDNIYALGILNTMPHIKARGVRPQHGTHPIPDRVYDISKSEQKAASLIETTVQGTMIWLKHVKAHKTDGSARSSVNNTVDRIAKEYMRERREEIIRVMKA